MVRGGYARFDGCDRQRGARLPARASPTQNAAPLLLIAQGEAVTVTQRDVDWCTALYDGVNGLHAYRVAQLLGGQRAGPSPQRSFHRVRLAQTCAPSAPAARFLTTIPRPRGGRSPPWRQMVWA